jgi:hypothetical protein
VPVPVALVAALAVVAAAAVVPALPVVVQVSALVPALAAYTLQPSNSGGRKARQPAGNVASESP